jgi:thiol-disulfide isomerase/thioredoxin
MGDWLYLRLAHVLAWAPLALAAAALAAGAALVVSARRARQQSPPRRPNVLARTVVWSVFAGSILTLSAAFVFMGPLFRSTARMEATLGREMPDIAFRHVTDDSVDRLSRLRGQVVLVNLWATWCGPCQDELPTLDRLQADYASKGLVVLTLADQPRDQVAPFLAEHAPRTLNGYVQTYGWLGIGEFRPHTLLIDRRGVLREFMFGSQDYELFERKVREYLD